MSQNNTLRLKEKSTLKCMLRGSGELVNELERSCRCTRSPQLRDELQKLAAAARNQQSLIAELLEDKK